MDTNKQYDNIAEEYLMAKKTYFDSRADWGECMFKMLPDLAGKTVVEIGCGDGSDFIKYKKLNAEKIIGIEPSVKMVEIANEKSDGMCHVVQGEYEHIPMNDGTADVVIGRLSLHYLSSFDEAYREVARILKTYCSCVFLVPHPLDNLYFLKNKIYSEQEFIQVPLFDGKVTVEYPSHSFAHYFSDMFLNLFTLEQIRECVETKIKTGITIPTLLAFKGRKRN